MELRLFNRGKDIRFVRPHRIAFLEWFRVVRHNIFCELTLMFDRLRTRLADYRTYWKNLNEKNELFPAEKSDRMNEWKTRLGHLVNGRRAADFAKENWQKFRTNGIRQSFWPLLFVIGLMIGFGLKSWAENHITIGYEDYKLEASGSLYDLNQLEAKFMAEQENPTPSEKKVYPACNIE